MASNLMNRITKVLKADAHGVVDALEDKSLLLKQCVREAELDLLQKRARLTALGEESERLDKEVKRRREDLASLDDDIGIALDGDEEELARFAIRKMIPVRKEIGGLMRATAEVKDAKVKLADLVTTQEAQLLELKQRARVRLAELSREPPDAGSLFGPAVTDEEVELELLRRRCAPAAGGVQ